MSNLIHILENVLPEMKTHNIKISNELVLHPSGNVETATENMDKIDLIIKNYFKERMYKEGRQLKNDIDRNKIKRPIAAHEELLKHLNRLALKVTIEDERVKIRTGLFDENNNDFVKGMYNHTLESQEVKIFNKALQYYKFFYTAHLKIVSCPSQFFYEKDFFGDVDLDGLLQKEYFKIKDQISSKYLKLKSEDGKHKLGIKLTLNKNEIIMQYIAFALREGKERSKLHIVTGTDFSGRLKNIYHLEQFVVEPEDYNVNEITKSFVNYQESGMPTVTLLNGIMNYKTNEFKTDTKTKEVFFLSEKANGEIVRRGNKDPSKYFTNYELLLKEPMVLGGPFFEYVVNYVSQNADKLKKIRKELQK